MFEASYSVVEAGLVGAYKIPKKALGAFRGRLGHLQRRGLFGAQHMPGRGVALAYRADQLHRLVFVCEGLELGLSPGVVLSLVKSLWERRLRGIFEKAEDAVMIDPGPNGENTGGDIILHMGGVHLMTDTWSNAAPNVNFCELRKLPDHIAMWMRMTPDDPARLPPRALVTNLTMRLRAFHCALADANLHDALTKRRAAIAAKQPRRKARDRKHK